MIKLMLSFLKHISFRLWIAVFLGGLLSLLLLPMIQVRIGLNWNLVPVAAILLSIFWGTGWMLNRWALNSVNRLVAEAGAFERDGMYPEAEDAFLKAISVFDSFLISPFVGGKISRVLGARMARFYLARTGRDEDSEAFLIAYIRANPDDEEVAEHWLRQIESGGGLKEEHQELAFQIGSAQPKNFFIQSVLARFYLLLERTDFPALQTYRRVLDGDEPVSTRFINELAYLFLKKKRADEWALDIYLQALQFNRKRSEFLKGLAACVHWIPETDNNKQLWRQACQYLDGIDENTLNTMRAGFKPPLAPSKKDHRKTKPRPKPVFLLASKIQTIMGYPRAMARWFFGRLRSAVVLIQQSNKARRVLTGVLLTSLVLVAGGLVVNTVSHLIMTDSSSGGKTDPSQKVISDPFTLQVAAYLNSQHAKRYVEKLKKQGLDAYWTEAVRGQKRWYQVRLSHFADKKSARDYGEELKSRRIIEDYYVANYRRP